VIQDDAATTTGIKDGIIEFSGNLNPGDFAYVFFSGHGQQVKDDNQDEGDGYDEAFVPYNSPEKFVKGKNEGQYLIRDDEFSELFDQLRTKIGKNGHLVVVLDSCHSGTGTRGVRLMRGTDELMADSIYIVQYE